MAGLIGRSGGKLVFPAHDATPVKKGDTYEWEGPTQPQKGSLGIVPQKNVLFSELSCFESVRLWRDVKRPAVAHRSAGGDGRIAVEETKEELEALLVDCGLEGKVHANAGSLSGGQKRKLQLAIGLVGGSESEFLFRPLSISF